MVVLDFNLDDNLLKSIKDNISLLDNLSYDRKKEELNHIFKSPNFNKYINMINELNIFKKLKIELKNDIIACDNALGIWSQIEFSNKYNFSKKDMNIILEVRKIIKNKKIDNYTVYKYKKESIIIASQILNINVNNIINNLVIKNRNDIDIKYDDLKLMFNNDEINDVYIDLEKEILYNRLKNEKESIIKYLNCKRGD
jgi:tRNA nucleotidyltransferase/poly(A) polymerase